MRIIRKNLVGLIFLLILVGCNESSKKNEKPENNGWTKDTQVFKSIENIEFTFPDKGYAFDNKERFINESFDALKADSELIQLSKLTDSIYIRFLTSRPEMKKHTGGGSSGSAWPYKNTLLVVANEEANPPIKHELMHLIAMLEWNYPSLSSDWMNEGLATFADNNCNGNNLAEIYRYLLENEKLIPMTVLSSDFYGQSEMVGYHQSGYIVQHLLENYNIEQFKTLWKDGFEKFEDIYGVPYSKVKIDLDKSVIEKYPNTPKIDWEVFNKGCQ